MGVQTALDAVREAPGIIDAMRLADDLAFEAGRHPGVRTLRVLASALNGHDEVTAIAAVHATGRSWAETDWLQISLLYDELARHDPSPVVRLNQTVAHAHVAGPADALARLEQLAVPLADYHLFHATRAELLDRLGRRDEAVDAFDRALAGTGNGAERELLQRLRDRSAGR